MKRTPFSRRPDFVRRALPPPSPIVRGVMVMVGSAIVSRPKENAIYSRPYRLQVAQLPCACCGRVGYSQAAHPTPTAKGRKEDDRTCFPLCCTRLLEEGCHVEYDQYRLIPTAEMDRQAAVWGAQTRALIMAAGKWPKNLPYYAAGQ